MPARSRSIQAKKTEKSRFTAYSYLLINTVTWGAALALVKPALEVTSPFRYLLYRYAIASVLVLPLVWKYLRKQPQLLRVIPQISWIELLGTTLSLSLLYFGLQQTSSIEASLIVATQPILITLAGIVFLREREEKQEWLGLLLAFFGTLLLTVEPLFDGLRVTGESLLGNVLVLLSNLTSALYFILAKKHYRKIPKLFSSSISFYIGFFTFFVLSILEHMRTQTGSELATVIATDLQFTSVWLAAIYMAVFGSIIGLTAYLRGQNQIEASEASIFIYLQPLVAIPLGFLLLHEKLGLPQVVALLLITSGVVWSMQRPKKQT